MRWLCASCHRKAHQVTGRCAGCHKTGPPRPLRKHVVDCLDWLALPPARQLDPEKEYARWQAEDKDDERAARRERAISQTTAARSVAGARFAVSRDLDAILDAEAGCT